MTETLEVLAYSGTRIRCGSGVRCGSRAVIGCSIAGKRHKLPQYQRHRALADVIDAAPLDIREDLIGVITDVLEIYNLRTGG
jgi:hypothetical protein